MQLVVVELCASRIDLPGAAASPFAANAHIIVAVRMISRPRTCPSSITRVRGSITHSSRRRNAPAAHCVVVRTKRTATPVIRTPLSPAPRRSALCREDVVAHRRGLALHVLQPVLDHVADRNDSDQAALLDDRDMAELALGHALHDAADGLALITRLDLAGHRLADGLVERGRAPPAPAQYRVPI